MLMVKLEHLKKASKHSNEYKSVKCVILPSQNCLNCDTPLYNCLESKFNNFWTSEIDFLKIVYFCCLYNVLV